jgi:hypothetical protein
MPRYSLDIVIFPSFYQKRHLRRNKACRFCPKNTGAERMLIYSLQEGYAWYPLDICQNCTQTLIRKLPFTAVTILEITQISPAPLCTLCHCIAKRTITLKMPSLQNTEFLPLGNSSVYSVDKDTRFTVSYCIKHLKQVLSIDTFIKYIKEQERI